MKIFSVSLSFHDHNTYDGKLHNQRERYTRYKHNVPGLVHPQSTDERMYQIDVSAHLDFYNDHYKPQLHELFAFTATMGGLMRLPEGSIDQEFVNFKPNHLWDYLQKDNIYYIDHHQSHAAYAFLSSGFSESDILAMDGRGLNFNCIFVDKNGKITDLSDKMGIGLVWNYLSKFLRLGHVGAIGAGKLMGLAAYGKYQSHIHHSIDQYVKHNLKFNGLFSSFSKDVLNGYSPEDIAYTLQYATQELIHKHVMPLKSCDNICIAGGVAYNGYINEEFTKHYTRVHVPPAPGDEGQSLGTYMHADFLLNDNVHIPNVYAGQSYDYKGDEKVDIVEVAQAIADGKIVGWYQGNSESGNRALGNRCILADPRNPDIKDIINSTIKFREDFRPFAPTVLEEHYQEYFDTNQSSPYMSRIVSVKSDKIPGVTHIDNTARIQTLNRSQNEKFYDLINAFYNITGIPMLLNTSFNCQEPMVETPEQAIRTFNKTNLHLLVIDDYILRKKGQTI